MSFVYSFFLAVALVLIQCFIGGTRPSFAYPTYAILGAAAVLSLVSIRRPSCKPSLACIGSALLFAGYLLIRAVFSPNPYLARSDEFLVVACLLVYLLTALYMTDSRARNWVMAALFLVAVVHVGVGMVQFRGGDNYMLIPGFSRGETYAFRASGMLICPNHLACFLEAAALLALGLTFWSRCRIQIKMLTGYIALVCVFGLAITGSRGGYLSFVAGVLVFVVLSLWIVRLYNTQGFSLAVLATLMAFVVFIGTAVTLMQASQGIRDRLHSLNGMTPDMRWHIWLAAADQFKTSPLVGTGAGTFLYNGRLFRHPRVQNDPVHAHNDYMELLAEYGVVGGVFGLIFLGVHVGTGVSTVRQLTLRRLCNSFGPARSDSLALAVGALGAVAALMAQSVVDFNMHIPGNALLFAFVFGMLANTGNDRQVDECADRREMALRGGLSLLGIGILTAVAVRYQGEQLSTRSRLAMEAAHYDECIRLAELAMEKDPHNPNSCFYLGEAHRAIAAKISSYPLREQRYEQAIAAYRKGLESFPENENLWVRLGQSFDGIYQFGEAEEAYLNAIRNDPNLGVLYAYYAEHLRISGDLEGAKECDDAAKGLRAQAVEPIGMRELPSLFNLDPPPPQKQ